MSMDFQQQHEVLTNYQHIPIDLQWVEVIVKH
jgi:hypothetical protein